MSNDIYYSFTYYDYDPNTFSYGDSYTGYGYADSTDGIAVGWQYQYDYAGNYTGAYYVDYTYDFGYNAGIADDVIVSSYTDADSGQTTYNVTTYGSTLGNEYGYADGDYFDAYYNYEADFSTGGTNDVYYSFTYYDYDPTTGTYGDSYTGWGVQDASTGIATGYQYQYDGYSGDFTGYYYVDYTYNYGADYGYESTYGVNISAYTDADSSGETTYDVVTYGSVLGSEWGYANGEYFDSAYSYDADWGSQGTAGDDYLSGSANDDYIFADAGNDTVYGNGGNDYIDGWTGNDYLNGGEGDDYILGYDGDDSIDGWTGNDIINGEGGADYILGYDGDDTIYGGTESDTLIGESGNDYLNGFGGYGGSYDSYEYDVLSGESSYSEAEMNSGADGADTFVLGDSSGAYYLGFGYATITDFYYAEGDKFQAHGSASDYSLGYSDWSGNGVDDTQIYYQGDLIGLVEDTTNVVVSADFIFV